MPSSRGGRGPPPYVPLLPLPLPLRCARNIARNAVARRCRKSGMRKAVFGALLLLLLLLLGCVSIAVGSTGPGR